MVHNIVFGKSWFQVLGHLFSVEVEVHLLHRNSEQFPFLHEYIETRKDTKILYFDTIYDIPCMC